MAVDDFSGFFVAYAIVFAIVVLYYLLFSTNIRAFFLVHSLRVLDRLFGLGIWAERDIRIGSLAFAFLSGKLFANHIELRDRNVCVRILQMTVKFNWWYSQVRQGLSKEEMKFPCRLSLELVGVEFVLHHTSDTYDELMKLIAKQSAAEAREREAQASLRPQSIPLPASQLQKQLIRDKKQVSRHWFHWLTTRKSANDPSRARMSKHGASMFDDDDHSHDIEMPMFFQWFPVTKLTIKSAAVMCGNMKLPKFLVWHFASAHCLYSIAPAISPRCFYSYHLNVTRMLASQAYFMDNPDYIANEAVIAIKRSLDTEDYFNVALVQLGKILSELDSELRVMQTGGNESLDQTRFIKSYKKGQNRSKEAGVLSHFSHIVRPTGDNKVSAEKVVIEEKNYSTDAHAQPQSSTRTQSQYAQSPRTEAHTHSIVDRERHQSKDIFFECGELSIDYVYDGATKLTMSDVSELTAQPELIVAAAPHEEARITFVDSVSLCYGPQHDHQRLLFMSYFLPFTFQNQRVYKPKLGSYRQSAYFHTNIVFVANSNKLRIPFRDNNASDASHCNQFIDCRFENDSKIVHRMGRVAISESGSEASLSIECHTLNVVTSNTNASLLAAEQFQLLGDLPSPLRWNDLTSWHYSLTLSAVKSFFLSDHIALLTSLANDWNEAYKQLESNPNKIGRDSLAYFSPKVQQFDITVNDCSVWLNVNQNNIVDHPNNLEENCHIVLKCPEVAAIIKMPRTEYKARAIKTDYELFFNTVLATVVEPLNHPLSELLETCDDNALTFNKLGITGSMLTHSNPKRDAKDFHSMVVHSAGVECNVYGHYLRALLAFYDNYLGDYINHLASSTFILTGYRNIESHVQRLARHEQHPFVTPREFSLALQFESLTMNFPTHLFTQSKSLTPQARCYELQLDIRSVQQYTDIFLSLSPVTITIPRHPSVMIEDLHGRQWNERETFVQFAEIKLSYASSKGEQPRSLVYRNGLKIVCEEFNCQLWPEQLAALATSLTNIATQFSEARDHSKPFASTSCLIPAIDSNNDPLELIRAKKQLTVYLQDVIDSGLIDSTVELSIGAVKCNLFHPPPTRVTAYHESRLSVTRLTLSQGAQFVQSTLITPEAHAKRTIEIPAVEVCVLVANDDSAAHSWMTEERRAALSRTASSMPLITPSPSFASSAITLADYHHTHCHTGHDSDNHDDTPARAEWLAIADFRCGLTVSVADQRADCAASMRKQQDFIYSQASADNDGETAAWFEVNAAKVPYTYNEEWATQAQSTFNSNASPPAPGSAPLGQTLTLEPAGMGKLRASPPPTSVPSSFSSSRPHLSRPLSPLSPSMMRSQQLHFAPMQSPPQRVLSQAQPLPVPARLSDRLRSHAQKRSVQIARAGILQLTSLKREMLPPQTPEVDNRNPRISYQRRPSLLAATPPTLRQTHAVPLPPVVPVLRPTATRSAILAKSVSQRALVQVVDADDDSESEDTEIKQAESLTRETENSFHSCQSLSTHDPTTGEMSGEETWQECRAEGEPFSVGVESDTNNDDTEDLFQSPKQFTRNFSYPAVNGLTDGNDVRKEGEANHHRIPSNISTQSSTSTASSSSIIPPLPSPASFVSTWPSLELQQYLERFEFQSGSHSWTLPRQSRAHLLGLHAEESLGHANSANVNNSDRELAGTAAAAFLSLPIAEFQLVTGGEEFEDSPPMFDDTMRVPFNSDLSHPEPHRSNRPGRSRYDNSTSASMRTSANSMGFADIPINVEDVDRENPTYTNKRHTLIQFVRDVSASFTPAFVASLDQYLPLIQTTHASIEETLDELHAQFNNAFRTTVEDELTQALAREKPFTVVTEVVVNVPSISVEFLQSSSMALSSLPLALKSSALVYSTILCVDSIEARSVTNFPLPEGFGTVAPSSLYSSLIDLAGPLHSDQPRLPPQLPTFHVSLSFGRMHLFSAILNPALHLSESNANTVNEKQGHSQQLPQPHERIGIPASELGSSVAPELLATSAVFVSWEIGRTRLEFDQSVKLVVHATDMDDTAANVTTFRNDPQPLAAGSSTINTNRRTSKLFTFEGVHESRPRSQSHSGSQESSQPSSPLHRGVNVDSHDTMAASVIVIPDSPTSNAFSGPPTTSTLINRVRPMLPKSLSWGSVRSPKSLIDDCSEIEMARARHHRHTSNPMAFIAEEDESESKEDSKRESESHHRHQLALPQREDSTDRSAVSPPTSAPNSPPLRSEDASDRAAASYHYHYISSLRIDVSHVHSLNGYDAPQRLAPLVMDWITAAKQLELTQIQNDADLEAIESHNKHYQHTHANNANNDTPYHRRLPSHRLLSLIPGGAFTAARRYRWQSVLSFALQHLQHSRVLSASGLSESDQIHFLQWYHYQFTKSQHVIQKSGRRLHLVTREESAAIGAGERDLVSVLTALGVEEKECLPPALQSRRSSDLRSLLPRFLPSALDPSLHAIIQSNTVHSEDVNFIVSDAAALTLVMRKLLRMPAALKRRLVFKLQRMDGFTLNANYANVSAGANEFHFDPELDYERLYNLDKLRLSSQLTSISLRQFARIAPQAAKVKAIHSPSELTPALWSAATEHAGVGGRGARFDSNHRLELDVDELSVEAALNQVTFRIINRGDCSDSEERDHSVTLNKLRADAQRVVAPRASGNTANSAHSSIPQSIVQSRDSSPFATPIPTPTAARSYPYEVVRVDALPSAAGSQTQMLRVSEVCIIGDCAEIFIEISPAIHAFVASVHAQATAMQPWIEDNLGDRGSNSGSGSHPTVNGAAPRTHHGRHRSHSDSTIGLTRTRTAPITARPQQSHAATTAALFGDLLVVHNFHTQLLVKTVGLRVLVPRTGALSLATSDLMLVLGRSIPSLHIDIASLKESKRRSRPLKAKQREPRVRTKPQFGHLRAASIRQIQSTGNLDGSNSTADYPVTTSLVKIGSLDVRLLDSDSSSQPLATMAAQQNQAREEGKSKRLKETVLTSLVTKKFIMHASYTHATTPLPLPVPIAGLLNDRRLHPIVVNNNKGSIRPSINTTSSMLSPPRVVARAPHSSSLAVIVNSEHSILTLPFYELESLLVTDYLSPWQPTMALFKADANSAPLADAPFVPVRFTAQLSNVSFVMLPLPSLMMTYHIDRFWCKLSKPKHGELQVILALGEQSEIKESSGNGNSAGASTNPASPSQQLSDPLGPRGTTNSSLGTGPPTATSHKVTLHAASSKRRRDRRSDEADAFTASHTRKNTSFIGGNLSSFSSFSSSYGGLGAVLYSKMQFVMDLNLPTLRASLHVKSNDAESAAMDEFNNANSSVAPMFDGQLDPAVAAELARLSLERSDSGSDDSDDSSNDSSDSDSDISDTRQPDHRRQASGKFAFGLKEALALRVVEGVIGVGSMSTHLTENVLNRLLHLQSTLNNELDQFIDKIAEYSKYLQSNTNAHAIGASVSPTTTSFKDQYCVGVSIVLADVDLKASLDSAKKPHHRSKASLTGGTLNDSNVSDSCTNANNDTYFDPSWDPMIEIRTGTVSLTVKHTPTAYRKYKQRRQETLSKTHRRRISKTFATNTGDASGASAVPPLSMAASDRITALSDIVVELNCYGVHIDLSTSGRERFDPAAVFLAPLPRQSLIQLTSQLKFRLGLDVSGEHIDLEIAMRQSLMKVTVMTAMVGSMHALADRYWRAYQHYLFETERMRADEEYHDPLTKLKQLQSAAIKAAQNNRNANTNGNAGVHNGVTSPTLGSASAIASDNPPNIATRVVEDPNQGSLAAITSLFDSLASTTHHRVALTMHESEIVLLTHRTSNQQRANLSQSNKRPSSDSHGQSRIYSSLLDPIGRDARGISAMSGPPSPSMRQLSLMSPTSQSNTSMWRADIDDHCALSPHLVAPLSEPQTFTAFVLSLSECSIQAEYIPCLCLPGVYSISAAKIGGSAQQAIRNLRTRATVNTAHTEVRAVGLEFGMLSAMQETNDLEKLAELLKQYRHATVSQSPPPSLTDTNTSTVPLYVYNRLLVRHYSFQMQASLPVITEQMIASRAQVVAQSQRLNKSRTIGRSHNLANSAPPSNYLLREVTVQVHSASSGCEVFVDPSIAHFIDDANTLTSILTSVNQIALDAALARSAPTSRSASSLRRQSSSVTTHVSPQPSRVQSRTVTRPNTASRTVSHRERSRSTSPPRSPRYNDLLRPDRMFSVNNGDIHVRRSRSKQRTDHARHRSYSVASSSDSSPSTPLLNHSHGGARSVRISPAATRPGTANIGSTGGSVELISRMDIVVEVEFAVDQGSISLHKNPRIDGSDDNDSDDDDYPQDLMSLPRVDAASGTFVLQSDNVVPLLASRARRRQALYGRFALPAIACTYIAHHAADRTDHALIFDVALPSLVAAPSVLEFFHQLQRESDESCKRRQPQRSAVPPVAQAHSEMPVTDTTNDSDPASSSLFTFLRDSAAARRNITVSLRVRPTSFLLSCEPANDRVCLHLSLRRPFDIAIAASALRPASVGDSDGGNVIAAVPTVSVVAHLPALNIDLGDRTTSGTSGQFLAVRVYHARLHFTQAFFPPEPNSCDPYSSRRSVLLAIRELGRGGGLTVSGVSMLLVFVRAWTPNRQTQSPTQSELFHPNQAHLTNANIAAQSTSPAAVLPVPLTYIQISIDRVKMEVSMLDLAHIHSRSSVNMSGLSCRVIDLGGTRESPKSRGLMLSANISQIFGRAEPDLDGLEGGLACNDGASLRILRIPLAGAMLTTLDESEEEDAGVDNGYEDGDAEVSDADDSRAWRRRHRRSYGTDESDFSDGSNSPLDSLNASPSHRSRRWRRSNSRHRFDSAAFSTVSSNTTNDGSVKRMVNRFECSINPISVRFSLAGGRVELIRGSTSLISCNIQDSFYPLAPEALGRAHSSASSASEPIGKWTTVAEIDLGEKISVAASSRALPYFIDLITSLIRFFKDEIRRYPIAAAAVTASAASAQSFATTGSHSLSRLPSAMARAIHLDDGSGDLRIIGRQIRIELLNENERDRAVVQLIEYQLSLNKNVDTRTIYDPDPILYKHFRRAADDDMETVITRTLLIDVGKHREDESVSGGRKWIPIKLAQSNDAGIYISRLTPPSDARDILVVPGFVMEHEIVEEQYQSLLESRFQTWWDRAVTVAVDPRIYKFLSATINQFVVEYSTAVEAVHSQAEEMRATAKLAAHRQSIKMEIGQALQRSSQLMKQRAGGVKGLTSVPSLSSTMTSTMPLPSALAASRLGSTSLSSTPKTKTTRFHVPNILNAAASSLGLSRLRSSSANNADQLERDMARLDSAGSTKQAIEELDEEEKYEDNDTGGSSGRSTKRSEEEKVPLPPPVSTVTQSTPVTGRSARQFPTAAASRSFSITDSEGRDSLATPSSSPSSSIPVKILDPLGVLDFNPPLHVLDSSSGGGLSSRRILELLGMKGELSVIPQGSHQLAMALDAIIEQCQAISRALDRAID